MKTKLFIILFVMVFALLKAETDIFDVKAPFEKATIYLENKGTKKGTEIIYIKDYGNTKATYSMNETKIFGVSNKEKTLEIVTPEWIYSFDLIKKTGYKTHNPRVYMLEEYKKLSKEDKKKFQKNAKNLSLNMMASFKGKVTENATDIMGYKCDKVEIMGTETYNIHNTGITLKMNSNLMGIKSSIEAVKIEKGKADEKMFELPKGIEVEYNKEADEQERQAVISMFHSIVSGEVENVNMPAENKESEKSEGKEKNNSEEQNFKKAIKGLQNIFGN